MRHYLVASAQDGEIPNSRTTENQQFIESLLKTIEDADTAGRDGWQLARVKIDSDATSSPKLDVWLKRQMKEDASTKIM